jgi:hypothetical protein
MAGREKWLPKEGKGGPGGLWDAITGEMIEMCEPMGASCLGGGRGGKDTGNQDCSQQLQDLLADCNPC